ncbi:MAG: ribosomal biogenesis protein [Desulfurococcaceae archaeon]
MILITTSHRPSPRVRSFVKDLASILPGAHRVNRGHKTLSELAIESVARKVDYLAIISEKGGNPSAISIYEIAEKHTHCPSPLKIAELLLHGVKLSREVLGSHKAYYASCISIDPSKCTSDDCYFIADLYTKIFIKAMCNKPDLLMVLEDDKHVTIKYVSANGDPVGPVISVIRALRFG